MHTDIDFSLKINHVTYQVDLGRPIDISIPVREGLKNVNCFYAPPVEFWPVVAGDFIGSTQQGGPVNFLNVKINPHGNGTHTECVGHIATEKRTIWECLQTYHFAAQLISVFPEKKSSGDRVITVGQMEDLFDGGTPALVIRTLPNDDLKMQTNYSGANPPYMAADAVQYLVENGVKHLLIDLPSVDREEDGGALAAHKAFWKYPKAPRLDATITELIYVPNMIRDGYYLLNLQTASFDIDVSPSKPVLYPLLPKPVRES